MNDTLRVLGENPATPKGEISPTYPSNVKNKLGQSEIKPKEATLAQSPTKATAGIRAETITQIIR